MSFSIEFADETQEYQARIKVIGCGGSGGNAVNAMMSFGLEGVEFVTVNTDAQALNASSAPLKIGIGTSVTRGLGAGADPEKGRKAALEDVTRIKEAIAGADMVFITAGMGGGTGTGAAPIIAQLAKEEGALTVGVVTKPFLFEGRQRARKAEHGIALLTEHVDTLITIPNEKLLALEGEDLSFIEAFRKADEVLYQAVKGISDLITQSGIVNVDFADVKTVMSNMGRSMMGTGCAKGQGRARLAAEMAIMSPLLDNISVEGATGVLINIVGGTVIATGFDREIAQVDIRKQAAERPAASGRSQSFAQVPVALRSPPASQVASSQRQPVRDEPAPAFSSRRPSAPAFVQASQPPLPMRTERLTLPAGMDSEWDTPTFQRKGQ